MKRRAGSFALVAGLTILALSTARCGQKVCVGGIGDCSSAIKEKDPNNPQVGDKQFTLKVADLDLNEGDATEITVDNSNEDWELVGIAGPTPTELKKVEKYKYRFVAPAVSTLTEIKLRGVDKTRYVSESQSPLAFDIVTIKVRNIN